MASSGTPAGYTTYDFAADLGGSTANIYAIYGNAESPLNLPPAWPGSTWTLGDVSGMFSSLEDASDLWTAEEGLSSMDFVALVEPANGPSTSAPVTLARLILQDGSSGAVTMGLQGQSAGGAGDWNKDGVAWVYGNGGLTVHSQITFSADIAEIPVGSAARTTFEADFKTAMATTLSVTADAITVDSIGAGSVIVIFSVASADATTVSLVSDALAATATAGAAITVGAYTGDASTLTPAVVGVQPAVPGPIEQAACVNGMQDNSETDVDCGGEACVAIAALCSLGSACNFDSDCGSYHCSGSVCTAPPPPTCAVGEYLVESSCVMCASGKYSATVVSTSESDCIECLAGRYIDVPGSNSSTDCIGCVAGKYVDVTGSDAASDCIDCDTGKYIDVAGSDDASDCIECAAGRYVGVTGTDQASDCINCAVGKFGVAGSDSVVECRDCSLGRYSATSPIAEDGCIACVAGRFGTVAAATDASFCPMCPGNSNSVSAATSLEDCVCAPTGEHRTIRAVWKTNRSFTLEGQCFTCPHRERHNDFFACAFH